MKRLFKVLLVAIMCVSLVGCGETKKENLILGTWELDIENTKRYGQGEIWTSSYTSYCLTFKGFTFYEDGSMKNEVYRLEQLKYVYGSYPIISNENGYERACIEDKDKSFSGNYEMVYDNTAIRITSGYSYDEIFEIIVLDKNNLQLSWNNGESILFYNRVN